MHDVLDKRDLVPDEAEQLLHSGHDTADLLQAARVAAADADYAELERIERALKEVPVADDWPYDDDASDKVVLPLIAALPDRSRLVRDFDDRVHGAWLGRCVGNTMGKPVEGLTRSEVRRYLQAVGQWPQTGYLPLLDALPDGVSHLHESAPFASAGLFEEVPRDDDLDWTILGLELLEQNGLDLSTEAIATAWLDRLPFTQTFTAERAAYRNLIRGVPASRAATEENPYREWIGALIRADIFGYVLPGRPAAAAALALRDARLSHVDNGVFGELWAAALVSLAFTCDSPREALEGALQVVAPDSRLFAALTGVLDVHSSGVTAPEALDWVDANLGHYNWVHTINNAALLSVGLLWGRDFTETVALTISGGRDTDSTAATAGSVYGALHGSRSVPDELVGTTHQRVRSAVRGFDRITVLELARRTVLLQADLS